MMELFLTEISKLNKFYDERAGIVHPSTKDLGTVKRSELREFVKKVMEKYVLKT